MPRTQSGGVDNDAEYRDYAIDVALRENGISANRDSMRALAHSITSLHIGCSDESKLAALRLWPWADRMLTSAVGFSDHMSLGNGGRILLKKGISTALHPVLFGDYLLVDEDGNTETDENGIPWNLPGLLLILTMWLHVDPDMIGLMEEAQKLGTPIPKGAYEASELSDASLSNGSGVYRVQLPDGRGIHHQVISQTFRDRMKGYGFAAKKARAKESAFDGDNMIVNEATFEAMKKNKDDPKYLVLADLTPLGALDLLTKAIITRGMEILARALGGTCNPTYGLDDRISDLQPTDTQPTQWAGHFAAYKHACDKYEMQGRDGWTRAMGANDKSFFTTQFGRFFQQPIPTEASIRKAMKFMTTLAYESPELELKRLPEYAWARGLGVKGGSGPQTSRT